MTITEEKKNLISLISKLKSEKFPSGTLKIHKNHNKLQYILKKDNKEIYIPQKNIDLVKALAQKRYNDSVVKAAEEELKVLENLNKRKESCIADIYAGLSPAMKELITPYEIPDKDYADNWLKTSYRQKIIEEGTKFFVTTRGDKVRSKSECIIADRLYFNGIPYRYEQKHILYEPFTLRQIVLYPDFTILNQQKREEIIWEHFGLMSNQEYTDNAVSKISLYNQNGYQQGKNIIYTFESASNPLQPDNINNIIKAFFLTGI